jgi:hypothetical protein
VRGRRPSRMRSARLACGLARITASKAWSDLLSVSNRLILQGSEMTGGCDPPTNLTAFQGSAHPRIGASSSCTQQSIDSTAATLKADRQVDEHGRPPFGLWSDRAGRGTMVAGPAGRTASVLAFARKLPVR